MRVYHGSSIRIDEIDLSKGRWGRDFGRGFYVTHDFDIVEGPVADDQVSKRIFLYQSGVLTKQEFLDELRFKKLTHQMCFCSALSLQMLTPVDTKFDAEIMLISDALVAQLITKEHLPDDKAVNVFYSSQLYSLLINPSTEYYKKSKDELYKQLLREL